MTPDSEKIGIPLTAIRRKRERNIRGGGVKFKGEDEFKGKSGVTHTQQKMLDICHNGQKLATLFNQYYI